jgi:hypothetical protein
MVKLKTNVQNLFLNMSKQNTSIYRRTKFIPVEEYKNFYGL